MKVYRVELTMTSNVIGTAVVLVEATSADEAREAVETALDDDDLGYELDWDNENTGEGESPYVERVDECDDPPEWRVTAEGLVELEGEN